MALVGERTVLQLGGRGYPELLAAIDDPPGELFVIGDVNALEAGLAVIGARKATPYGLGCARRFSSIAAQKGIVIISGGANGCDSQAHRAALEAGGRTVAVLGGGCDKIYPAGNYGLFQKIIDQGGAVASEHSWSTHPRPYYFRMRNRIIAGLAKAVLIVEAGLPSGTFSTADHALDYGKDVLVVPGAITSSTSRGSNRLMLQGAHPIVDDESFEDVLFNVFGLLKYPDTEPIDEEEANPLVAAIRAEPLAMEDLLALAKRLYGNENARGNLMEQLAQAEALGKIARQRDGRWGPTLGPPGTSGTRR